MHLLLHAGLSRRSPVPDRYAEDRPAGIHLFFHGQGGHGGARDFGRWRKHFCEPFNLIGINMAYQDGDNAKDTGGKAEAAALAISQVMADYRVVARGAVASFSGGGLPHALLFQRAAGPAGPGWPFTHMALYGSNYWQGIADGKHMSWFLGLGGKEWDMGKPTLGTSQVARTGELFALTGKRRSGPDIHLRIEAGKGHAISDADVAASAEQFRRSDLLLGRFLHEPSWSGKARAQAATANTGGLGRAETEIARLLAGRTLADEDREQLSRLQAQVAGRIESVVQLCTALAGEDAALAGWYGGMAVQQLAGSPRQQELRKLLTAATATASARSQAQAHEALMKLFPGLFQSGGRLTKPDEQAAALQRIADLAGGQALAGIMAREFLALR